MDAMNKKAAWKGHSQHHEGIIEARINYLRGSPFPPVPNPADLKFLHFWQQAQLSFEQCWLLGFLLTPIKLFESKPFTVGQVCALIHHMHPSLTAVHGMFADLLCKPEQAVCRNKQF
eukprot:1160449-Pelagomonas_calceolata.AAC.16